MRELLKNPLLPLLAEINDNPQKFIKERWILTACLGGSLFVIIFLVRLAWYLPSVLLADAL